MKNSIWSVRPWTLAGIALVGLLATPLAAQVPAGNTASAPSTSAGAGPTVAVSPNAQEVLKLTRAQVGDDTILAYIQSSGKTYELTASQIVFLKEQGVTSPVLAAMLQHPARAAVAEPVPAANSAPPPAAPAAPAAAPAPAAPVYAPAQTTYVVSSPAPSYYYYPNYYYYPYYNGYYGYSYPGWSVSVGLGGGWYWGGSHWGGRWGGGHWGGGYGGYRGGGGGFHGGGGHGGHR